MSEVWKLNKEYYTLYTENKDVIRRIKRYYKDFELMAEYQKGDKIFARQYKVPIKRKRVAKRLDVLSVFDCFRWYHIAFKF